MLNTQALLDILLYFNN